MIREYRGKRIDNGEWAYGDLLQYAGTAQIWYDTENGKWNCIVDPETVGQWCGKEDKTGEKIFAGEYLGEWCEDEEGKECFGHYGIVTYWEDECKWVLADENGLVNDWTYEDCAQPENWGNLYCLGSIHDNPELLEVQDD